MFRMWKRTALISDFQINNMKSCPTMSEIYLISVPTHMSKSFEDLPIASSLNIPNRILKGKHNLLLQRINK